MDVIDQVLGVDGRFNMLDRLARNPDVALFNQGTALFARAKALRLEDLVELHGYANL
jgi:hypothetical protein